VLKLTGTNIGGRSATATRVVQVDGRLKLGNLTFSATDLTVPVAGIPITIGRTYDSTNATRSGDFGYGWKLTLGGYSATVDPATTAPSFLNGYATFRAPTPANQTVPPTHIYVKRPDGGVDGYTFTPVPAEVLFGIVLSWYPAFTPDDLNVLNALVADQIPLNRFDSTGEYFDYELGGYNPANPSFGGAFDIVEYSGLKHEVDARTGKQLSVRDRNENKLTFTGDAIVSNRGVQVTFQRDAQGRIIAAQDPRGNRVRYRYNTQGDLVEVTDRANNPPTRYTYDPNHAHFLATVVDSLGTRSLQASYNTNGRLQLTVDAKGNPVNFAFDTNTLTETISDPQTPPTTLTFDPRGNLKQSIDATGAQSMATYNNTQPAQKDLPDTITNVRRNPDGTSTSFTTQFTYDAKGQVLSTTDPAGAVTRLTYGPFGAVLTVSDPLGNTVAYNYDTNGNLLSTASPEGVTVTFEYDTHHNLTARTEGNVTSRFGYDLSGYLMSSTTPTGVTTNYTHDANGNPTGTSFPWVNPNPPGDVRTVRTTVVFDANDRPVQSTDGFGGLTRTQYDRKGRVTQTIDTLNNSTSYIADARDEVIQMNYPNGTVSRTVYDAEGRVSYTDDPHIDGQPARGTSTLYDNLGRVRETDRLADLVITVTTINGVSTSQVVSPGTVLSRSTSTYNDLGQETQSLDDAGQPTSFQYDPAGRRVAVTNALNETILSTYDAAGRKVATQDALGHTTRYVYDGDGRLLQTIFPDLSFTSIGYDRLGRKSSTTDPLGRTTTYQYDPQGRLSAVVLPPVFDPETQQPVQPTTQYSYDAYGDLTTIQDAKGRVTQFTFDQFGHQLSQTLPGNQTERTSYDAFGRKDTHIDFKGQKEQFHYDGLGRVDTKTFLAAGSTTPGETVTYQLDSLGRVNHVTDIMGANQRPTHYRYDPEDRVTLMMTLDGAVNYAYDPATGFHTRTYTAKSDITYAPDQLQRLKTVTVTKQNGVTLATPLVTTYFYTKVGTVDHLTYPNGTETDYGYDPLNRLTSVANKAGNTVLSSYVYTLRADGLRIGATETDSTATVTRIWAYDALQRLAQENYASTIAAMNYTDQYAYDRVGNRLSKTHTAGGQILVASDQYNANDQLTVETGTLNGTANYQTTYGYDDNGFLTSVSRTGSNAESDTYGYDLQNRLTTANISRTENGQAVTIAAGYTYDDQGFRAQSVVTTTVGSSSPVLTTTQFLVDVANPTDYPQILEEHSNGAAAPSLSYVSGLRVLAQTSATGAPSYLLPDGQGSTRLVVDAGGGITARYNYDAYGNLLGSTFGVVNPPATRILYVGQEVDLGLQEYYLRARYYITALGRFPSRDSFRGNLLRPISLHKYVYAADQPVSNSDPSGREDLFTVNLANGISTAFRGQTAPAYFATYGELLRQSLAITTATALAYATYQAVKGGTPKKLIKDIASGRALQREVQEEWISAAKAVRLKLADRNTVTVTNNDDEIPIFVESLTVLPHVAQVDLDGQLHGKEMLLSYDSNKANNDARRKINLDQYDHLRTAALDSLEEYPFASTWNGGEGAYVGPVPLRENLSQGGIFTQFILQWQIKSDEVFLVFIVP
jgi:RHS repeat-associated protein